jgi:signal transduction histidine kinase
VPGRLTFDRWSLRWRLCCLLLATAVLTVTAFGLFAYRTARNTTLDATQTRLHSALAQLTSITEPSIAAQLDALRAVARDRVLIEALRHPAQPWPDAATAVLRKLQGPSQATASVELRAADGTMLYPSAASSFAVSKQPFVFADEPVIGPLVEAGDFFTFNEDATVFDEATKIGGLRLTRRLARNVNRRLTASLLGEQSALLIGNKRGAMWSDTGTVAYPGVAGTTIEYERNGMKWESASSEIKGTPWVFAMEIPERAALAPARALFMPFLATGVAIALIAIFIGWTASKRIISPLAYLTKATEAIARGERNVPLVAVERKDEIGRLARSFASMAQSVQSVRDRLESDIDARTGELTMAVGRLSEMDAELQRNERFATIGRLSGSVGHELRNPLSVMSSVVFLLDALPDASPKLKDYSSLLREQIRLSERIISDLLDRARHSAPQRQSVDVPTFLNDLIARAGIPSTVNVERQFPASMPLVTLDRDHVGQIVWNLITNAVQAMYSAGVLQVNAILLQERLLIEVCDSGPGVPEADHERVFEPLYTTKANGVGLGLSVSRAYARSNGGDLYVKDHPGGTGACFCLDLPVGGRASAQPKRDDDQRADRASKSASAS